MRNARRTLSILAVAGAVLAAAGLAPRLEAAPDPAPALTAVAGGEVGRYTMTPTDGGVIRLDTRTGAVAFCSRKDSGRWACEDMDDSQRALMSEIDRLEAENRSLKAHADHLEESLGADAEGAPTTKLTLPSEEDVDKAFDYFEGMLKKLHKRLERLKQDHERDGQAL